MNAGLKALQPYPFEKLERLKTLAGPPPTALKNINLSIGEPQHKADPLILETLTNALDEISSYPKTRGGDALRQTIKAWLVKRFALNNTDINADDHILPVNGTREALFSFAQCVIDNTRTSPTVLMPNPLYQIYEGAALLAGAMPVFMNCNEDNDYQPDFSQISDAQWQQCQLLYLCSPANPSGSIISEELVFELLKKSEQYNFIIAADECYSEIYTDESAPPKSLLEHAAGYGNTAFTNCMVFHSLSKRSNLPGIRSGFVAGDAEIIKRYYRYRTYHGCAMPGYVQSASIAAWSDETHVRANRQLYREKFDAVLPVLSSKLEVSRPDAGFYLWPKLMESDVDFTQNLHSSHNVTVLPGSYLSRSINGVNPGMNRVRMALVAELEECVEAAGRIISHINQRHHQHSGRNNE